MPLPVVVAVPTVVLATMLAVRRVLAAAPVALAVRGAMPTGMTRVVPHSGVVARQAAPLPRRSGTRHEPSEGFEVSGRLARADHMGSSVERAGWLSPAMRVGRPSQPNRRTASASVRPKRMSMTETPQER